MLLALILLPSHDFEGFGKCALAYSMTAVLLSLSMSILAAVVIPAPVAVFKELAHKLNPARIVWSGICVLGLFSKQVLVLIHSDVRLLCGTDAAIGAGIGYLAHNPLIGALAGGILGLANYELVSIRWLKLVPR